MKSEHIYRTMTVILLGSILIVQLAILERTPQPITIATLKAAGSRGTAVMQNIPLVTISGEVGVNVQNSIAVKNEPFSDLDVHVQNEPLSVNIDRSN